MVWANAHTITSDLLALVRAPEEDEMNTEPSAELEGTVTVEVAGDWRAELRRQMDALGRDVLGIEPSGRKLAALCAEIEVLACVASWFGEQGNITQAAKRRGTNRKLLRDRVNAWKARCPHLVPEWPPRTPSSEEDESKRAERKAKCNARRRAARAKARAAKAAHAAKVETPPAEADRV